MFIKTELDGVMKINNFLAKDHRGVFVKTFQRNDFELLKEHDPFCEHYYSMSFKNVIRGMHFQLPPFDHHKLVYVTHGEIVDVILDLRKASPTYGKYLSLELRAFGNSVFIPKGCAHGFLTLSDFAIVNYCVTTVHNASADSGVHWNSFGYKWNVQNPVVSSRDESFQLLADFISTF